MINLIDISKTYKGKQFETKVLEKLNLYIKDNEFLAIMGKSGTGKTTLLNLIGAMDEVSNGSIEVDGVDITKMSRRKKELYRRNNISFVFQNYALMKEFTVYENIELPLDAKGFSSGKKRKIVNDAMEKVGISHLKNSFPSQISGGEQQRVAIARALASGNKYILADEPTGAIDSENANSIMECLRCLVKEGRTVIMVTHDRSMADFADRIVLLKNGIICEEVWNEGDV